VPCHRIDVIESKRGDGTFPDSFCGDSEHQKWVETAKPRRIHGTRGDIRVSSAQQSVGAVGSDPIWEMSPKVFVSVVSVTVSLIEQVTDVL